MYLTTGSQDHQELETTQTMHLEQIFYPVRGGINNILPEATGFTKTRTIKLKQRRNS
jgi:hypothetical protein